MLARSVTKPVGISNAPSNFSCPGFGRHPIGAVRNQMASTKRESRKTLLGARSLFLIISAIHEAAASGSEKLSAAAPEDLVGAAMVPAKALAAARKLLRVTFISN